MVLDERLRAVEHLAGVGFWEWRIPEDVTMWSDSLFRIFGFEPGKFGPSYQAWLDLIHDEDREEVERLVNVAFAEGSSYAFDHRIVWPDGEVRLLHCRGQVYSNDDGAPVRIAGISEDVTRRRAVEANERRFVADAAHELRTPVAGIEAAGQVIGRAQTDEHRKAGLAALERQVRRLSQLTTSLLNFESVHPSGQVGLVLTRAQLKASVERSVSATPVGEGRSATVEVDPGIHVRVDTDHLDRVLVILLDNARRYGGPNVLVRARSVDSVHVAVDVIDDGPGVAQEVRADLFEAFSRGRHAEQEGSGLGLAIARRLVEGLGGRLTHQAVDAGGAQFTLTLEVG